MSDRRPVRTFLVEHHWPDIQAVRDALQQDERFEFLGYITSRSDLDEFLDAYAPDLAVVDMHLPKPKMGIQPRSALTSQSEDADEGRWIIKRIRETSPQTMIVGFSNYFFKYPTLVHDVLACGATPLPKLEGPTNQEWPHWLCRELLAIWGDYWRPSPEMAALMHREKSTAEDSKRRLTERQMEVARLFSVFYPNPRIEEIIGDILFITPEAVRGHIANIKKRLELDSRWEIAEFVKQRSELFDRVTSHLDSSLPSHPDSSGPSQEKTH